MVSWSWSWGVGFSFRIDWSSLVGDLSHVPVVMVDCVLDVLDPAVRESHRVGAGHHLAITTLRSIEVSLGVIISHSVLEGVGLLLALGLVVRSWGRGGVSWSWNRCRGRVGWSRSGVGWSRGRSWVGWSHVMRDHYGSSMDCMVDRSVMDRCVMNRSVMDGVMDWGVVDGVGDDRVTMMHNVGGNVGNRGRKTQSNQSGNNKSLQ